MKKTSVLILPFLFYVINCFAHENKQLGFKFTLPLNWDSVGVIEANKPQSVFEAVRLKDHDEFMTLVVIPTRNQAVDKERLYAWQSDMEKGFGISFEKSKDARIQEFSGDKWYSILIYLKNGSKVYSYYLIRNGYIYSLSFINKKTNQKQFESEIKNLLSSFSFETPGSLQNVKSEFNNPLLDSVRNFYVPENFYLTTSIDRKLACPYVYNLYNDMLRSHNTDCVLVSENYFNQLFCLNIKYNMVGMNEMMVKMLSGMAAGKIRQEGGTYDELFAGPWDKSPEKVLLQKYRFTKNGEEATVYIFYCLTGDKKTNVIKVQMSPQLEGYLEDSVYNLILKNL
jgi:hypothetical protein